MAKKLAPLSPGAVDALKGLVDNPATVADLKAAGIAANPSHLTALIARGYVTAEPVDIEVVTVAKRTVNSYTITDAGRSILG